MVINLALSVVNMVLSYTGLDPRTPTGIINWGIVIYGLFNPRPPSPAQVATAEQSFLIRQGSKIQQFVITRVKTTVRAFSDAPGGLMRIIKAAKYYAEHEHGARQAVSDACSGAVRTVLGTLVSSDTVRQDMLIQLGEKFGAIMTSVDPGKAAEMKCKFVQQFTDQAGAELLQELQTAAIIDPAKMRAAVLGGCVSQAAAPSVSVGAFSVPPPPPQPSASAQQADPRIHPQRLPLVALSGIAKASTPRNRNGSRWDVGDPKKKTGGSSKHKKKHSRPTNKRKLLKSSNRRRSMKHET
jgi:hypothetical protein